MQPIIYNSRNYLIRIDWRREELRKLIYNSRNYLIRIDSIAWPLINILSTIVEIT